MLRREFLHGHYYQKQIDIFDSNNIYEKRVFVPRDKLEYNGDNYCIVMLEGKKRKGEINGFSYLYNSYIVGILRDNL
jgi:hypothetical protein